MSIRNITHPRARLRNSVLIAGVFLLAACAEGQGPAFLQNNQAGGETVARAATSGATTVERDIEAPEVFRAAEAGLWDGRPSLGGVWVAHPDVTDPERVIIRNEQNGKFVIGALFRRERETPGPRVQVSSDAAEAIGMLAGQPTNLDVVALRREEVPTESAAGAMPADGALDAPEDVAQQALDPVVTGASAALQATALPAANAGASSGAEPRAVITPAAAPATPAPAAKPSALSKPFVQIGIFSIEQNAKNTATAMRQQGMVPTIKKHSSRGKTFWRVVVGPAQSQSELKTLIGKIRDTGFSDAYAVKN